MLPHLSGIEVCRRLRRRPPTQRLPIIILTARTEEPDRLRGLDTGADDFIVKPFSVAEVVARIRAVLRRARPSLDEAELEVGALKIDLGAHRVFRDGREIHLSPTEFRLLRHLMEHPGRVFSRAALLDAVWGINQEVELRTVDATVRRLRRALNAGGGPDLLRTVRAEGYALDQAGGAADGARAEAIEDADDTAR
jgi:two-component system phosphate regulon response regulator PhoB